MANQNAGNSNTDGFTPLKTRGSMGPRPGAITRGPGHNKPRVRLNSVGTKLPAEVYAQALAARDSQKNTVVNPKGSNGSQTNPGMHNHNETRTVRGVKPHFRPVRPSGGVS